MFVTFSEFEGLYVVPGKEPDLETGKASTMASVLSSPKMVILMKT